MELWLVRRTHTRGVYTHEKTPFLLSGLAEPNWASTESSARGSTRKRAKLRRERDLSDRLTTKLWTDTSPSSPYHFARCHAVIPVPLSYPRLSTSNLPFSLLFVAWSGTTKHAYIHGPHESLNIARRGLVNTPRLKLLNIFFDSARKK